MRKTNQTMKHLRKLLLNTRHQQQARHQQQILQIQAKKMKGCQLPTIEKKVEKGIALTATHAKADVSINKAKGPT